MGWTAQYFTLIVIEGPNAAILLYAPTGGLGNLVGSWSAVGYTDQYGNTVPQGINVNQGVLNSVSIVGADITASTIENTIITAATIVAPTLSSGTIFETQITFDTNGGQVVGYTSTTTTVTQTANGNYNFTVPAGVTTLKVELWGAGAGGDGGSGTAGGPGGGAGEYACEPTLSVTPGATLPYSVGNGGNGGTTNGSGTGGGDTSFNSTAVYANGGDAGSGVTGGAGGTGSKNSIHFDGGTGGNSGGTGGASGGNSGNSTAKGNNGIASSSSSGAAQPAAQTGSGRGGAGGATTVNGNAGGAPGGAGGGAGSNSGSGGAFSQTFDCTSSRSYYGSDATNGKPNQTRNSNGTCWQGGETATGGTANGTQKCVFLFNSSAIVAACAGVTITELDFSITNEHSWYGSGITLDIREWLASQGSSLPASWNGNGSPDITQQTMGEGVRKTFAIYTNTSLPADFADGTANGIALGPGATEYDLSFYGYFNGTPNSSSGPQVTMKGTKGSGFNTAGAGQDGQSKITYASSSTIVFALAAVAGGDGTNTWAAGYTGPTTAFNPSSGTAPEVWHTMGTAGSSLGSGWTNQTGQPCQFMLDSNGIVHINGVLNCSSGHAEGAQTLFTLPAAWSPNRTCYIHYDYFGYTAANEAMTRYLSVGTDGTAKQTFPAATTITAIIISDSFPLVSNTSLGE